jgi:anti-anti-sigma factor
MLTSTLETIIVRAPKRLDMLTAPHLANDLANKIREGCRIILDLGHTQYLDTSSAEVILQGLAVAKQRKARLGLRNVNAQVSTVLELAGVLQYFRKS